MTTERNPTVNAILRSRMMLLVQDIKFQNYEFDVTVTGGGEVVLWASYEEPDVYTNRMTRQYTRRWVLSPHMTDSELVSTAFKCCMTSMEHRAREHFKFKNARIYGPHFDVQDLVQLCIARENAGARVES